MPPLRRYLRITKYSVLECRIYLDNPADAHRWLLNEISPVLPRVIEAVRPLVLPKLREENARAKSGKGGKKKGWKDVVIEDDFEVAIFLTEVSARHAILRKEKKVKGEKARLRSRGGRLTGVGTEDMPVEIEDGLEADIVREGSQEENVLNLRDIPAAEDVRANIELIHPTKSREQALPVSGGSGEDDSQKDEQFSSNGGNCASVSLNMEEGNDDKKMPLSTTYDGFSIYGRILCLVVKRRGWARGKASSTGGGQAMMEEWIASTQMGEGLMMED